MDMMYTNEYDSPLGKVTMASDGESLTGLWLEGQKYFAASLSGKEYQKNLPVFECTKEWLNVYFKGKEPDFMPSLAPEGTSFRREIWNILQEIPYGRTMTYGEIGRLYAKRHGVQSMSGQAVGQAVGHNPISILIPCHRVLGSNGSLTGYAGGVEKKRALLKIEKVF